MKIELRERTAGHVRVYFERTQDEQIERMLPRSVESLEQALANFEATLLPGAASFGRTIYADGRYVGDVWCYCIDCEQSPNAMLSYCIFDKALWGKGAATEAVGLFLQQAVERFSLRSVGAFTFADNKASIRVLEKNGFAVQESFVEDGRESVYLERGC